jgi:hypothetical protein
MGSLYEGRVPAYLDRRKPGSLFKGVVFECCDHRFPLNPVTTMGVVRIIKEVEQQLNDAGMAGLPDGPIVDRTGSLAWRGRTWEVRRGDDPDIVTLVLHGSDRSSVLACLPFRFAYGAWLLELDLNESERVPPHDWKAAEREWLDALAQLADAWGIDDIHEIHALIERFDHVESVDERRVPPPEDWVGDNPPREIDSRHFFSETQTVESGPLAGTWSATGVMDNHRGCFGWLDSEIPDQRVSLPGIVKLACRETDRELWFLFGGVELLWLGLTAADARWARGPFFDAENCVITEL